MENQQAEGTPQEKALSPEEVKKMRSKIVADYKEEIGFLKIQSQYETLLAEIEEAKFKRYNAIAKTAQLFAHMEQQEQAMEQARAEYEKAHEEAMKQAQHPEQMHVVKEEAEITEKKSRRLATPD
jgi:hypothetical protein